MLRRNLALVEIKFVDEIDRLSVETSHPRWLIEKWVADVGADETENISIVNNEIPQTAFRPMLASQLIDPQLRNSWQMSDFVENTFIAERADQHLREMERNGTVYFQDEGSQMLANLVKVPDGGTFLDVCAAPGGKTGIIAQRYADSVHLLVAGDLHWPRIEYLRENCARQDVGFVNIIQYDAVKGLPFADATFDTVLVDAPCSGTGTIRHNPEIRYYLKPEDFRELASKQLLILTNASKTVKQGGVLVYATCSLEPEENESVAQRFLAENPSFELTAPNLPARFVTTEGFARTWPHLDSMDGFFAAVFVRNI